MTTLRLITSAMRNGEWSAQLSCEEEPQIRVEHDGARLDEVEVTPGEGDHRWRVAVRVPAEWISDGVQSFVVWDAAADRMIDSFTIMAGDMMHANIHAEVRALRAELEVLKSVVRAGLRQN